MSLNRKPVFLNRIALLWLALATCLVSSAVAQRGIDVEGAIRTGAWKPYKIAIDDFKVVGQWSSEADSLARLVQKVITDDLDFHIFFDTIPKSEFYLQVWEITQLTPQIWFRMGADYLITGEVELEGQDIKIYYTISELNPRIQTLKTEKLKTRTFNYRRIAIWYRMPPLSISLLRKGFSQAASSTCLWQAVLRSYGFVTTTAPTQCRSPKIEA